MWRCGIDTSQSCEAWAPGTVWIAFPDVPNAANFVAALRLEDGTDELAGRATLPEVASPDSTPPLPWEWRWSALVIESVG